MAGAIYLSDSMPASVGHQSPLMVVQHFHAERRLSQLKKTCLMRQIQTLEQGIVLVFQLQTSLFIIMRHLYNNSCKTDWCMESKNPTNFNSLLTLDTTRRMHRRSMTCATTRTTSYSARLFSGRTMYCTLCCHRHPPRHNDTTSDNDRTLCSFLSIRLSCLIEIF